MTLHNAGIKVKDVTVTYRNGHTALHDTSFEIPTGTITALVGVRKRALGGLKLSSWIYSNICFTDINKRVML